MIDLMSLELTNKSPKDAFFTGPVPNDLHCTCLSYKLSY